jgi:hypothetical protein
MRFARGAIFWLSLATAAATPARADSGSPGETAPPAQSDRFSMTPTQSGFLRLDKQTGAVSFCTVEAGLSACRIGADERAAFESEIARLQRENAELKSALGGAPRAPSASPKDEEFERAMSYAERFMRRMMRLFKEEGRGDKL